MKKVFFNLLNLFKKYQYLLFKLPKESRLRQGFTIVELLVVIVVIGILAAITIISYTGIKNKAVIVSLASDLSGASKLLKMDQITNSAYPTTLSLANDGRGIPSSAGTIYQYDVNNDSVTQTFSLTATNNDYSYNINQDGTVVSGGRNLLKNSRMNYIPTGTGTGSVKELIVDPIHGSVLHVNAQWVYQSGVMSITQDYQVGDNLNISFYAKSSVQADLSFTLYDSSPVVSNIIRADIGTDWGYYTGTAIVSRISGSTVNFYYYPSNAGVEFWFKNIKVEKGGSATNWTPSIE